MKWIIAIIVTIIIAIATALCISVAQAQAPEPTLELFRSNKDGVYWEWNVDRIKYMMRFVSKEYGYKYSVVDWLVLNESSYRIKVYGDNNKAFGLGQWHQLTWEHFQKKYNRFDLDKYNPTNQIEMLCLALKDKQFSHWTPFQTKNHPPL